MRNRYPLTHAPKELERDDSFLPGVYEPGLFAIVNLDAQLVNHLVIGVQMEDGMCVRHLHKRERRMKEWPESIFLATLMRWNFSGLLLAIVLLSLTGVELAAGEEEEK